MAVVWIKTTYPGVRYREHPTRKQKNGQPDKYFTVRYKVKGKDKEEGVGWATEGWNPGKAHGLLAAIKEALKTGSGHTSLAAMREGAAARYEEEAHARAKEALGTITVASFVEHYYMPLAKRTKRTWQTDEYRLKKAILPVLGGLPLAQVTKEDVQRLLDAHSHQSAATVKQYMTLVRRLFNVGMQTIVEGTPLFTGTNPAAGAIMAPVKNARVRYLTGEEAENLIAAAKRLRSPDLHDAIVLCLNTGLRIGELLRMQWGDIDETAAMLTVMDDINRKPGGKIPLNAAATAILHGRKARGKSIGTGSLVFPSLLLRPEGEHRHNLSHMFRKVAKAIGLNDGITDPRRRVVFHTLRHTFASWLAIAGTDIYRIQTLMRHKTIQMTARYAHLIPDETRAAVHNLRPPT